MVGLISFYSLFFLTLEYKIYNLIFFLLTGSEKICYEQWNHPPRNSWNNSFSESFTVVCTLKFSLFNTENSQVLFKKYSKI